MANVSTWSVTAASNNAAPPDGWPEGQAPSTVNDCAREMMAALRRQFQDAEWFDWGDVPTRTGANTFTVPTNATSRYLVNRRIKLNDATTLYATISDSTFSAATTTVTVTLDSGSLTASLTAASLAIISPNNLSIDIPALNGINIASTVKTDTATTTSTAFTDISGMSVNIRPTSMQSKVLVLCTLNVAEDVTNAAMFYLVRNSSVALGLGNSASSRVSAISAIYGGSNISVVPASFQYLDTPSSTATVNYKIQWAGRPTGTNYLNRSRTDTDSGDFHRTSSHITVLEII